MSEVVVTGDLGPNPAPVVELVWALHAHRGLRTTGLHLLTNDHAARWFHELEDGLDQLERVVGWRPAIRVHEPPVETEDTPEQSVAWNEARWDCAQEALAEAGTRPVVFGLFAGRRRSMASGVTQIAQLLARPQDLLLDVRVSTKAVEGATGFYFPEQPEPTWNGVDPAGVQMTLAELAVPRLRGRFPQGVTTWRAAMAWSGTPVPGEQPPTLEVQMGPPGSPRLLVNGAPVAMSPALTTWVLALALARLQGSGWIAADDTDPLRDAIDHVRLVRGQNQWRPDTKLYAGLTTGTWTVDADGALRKLRRDTRKRLREHCLAHGVSFANQVVPSLVTTEGATHQRIALAPERITIQGWPVT